MLWTELEGVTVAQRYELQHHLATGGMAAVFGGWDCQLERPVAVKMLRSLEEADDTELRRFRREARAIAALHSPHIVDLYDFVEEGGCYYLVMELVGGETLKQLLLQRAPLPVERALPIAIQVCRALAIAHARGFVHRDIKPQNVLIDADGRAKLADFGIVHIPSAPSLTTSGLVLGTADYISPEQAQGLPLTPASDLYSLGIMLYEMLTGCLPFTGRTATAVALRHATDPLPPLRLRNAWVPAEVERLVRRATDKNPAHRFRSARQMEAEIAWTLDTAPRGGGCVRVLPIWPSNDIPQPPPISQRPRAWRDAPRLASLTAPIRGQNGLSYTPVSRAVHSPSIGVRRLRDFVRAHLSRFPGAAKAASAVRRQEVRFALTCAVALVLLLASLLAGVVR